MGSTASTGSAASPASASIHDDKPWVELFQEVIVCGVSRRVAFKPRADYRLIVAEMAPNR
jgi:hypothetical protein